MQNDFLTPYKEDSGVPPYLPFPRFLVPMDLSNDAKVLYALLLDRAGISNQSVSEIRTQRPDHPQKAGTWPSGGHYAEYFACKEGA